MTATRLLTAPIDASAWERAPGNRHARQAAKYSPAASHDRKIVAWKRFQHSDRRATLALPVRASV
jgi:hypothetical protein